jgi:hypothetical protein
LSPASSNKPLVETHERLFRLPQLLCLQSGRRFRQNEPTDPTNKTLCLTTQRLFHANEVTP